MIVDCLSDDEGLPGDAQERDGGYEAGHEGAGDGHHPRPPVSHQELQTCLLLTSTESEEDKYLTLYKHYSCQQ